MTLAGMVCVCTCSHSIRCASAEQAHTDVHDCSGRVSMCRRAAAVNTHMSERALSSSLPAATVFCFARTVLHHRVDLRDTAAAHPQVVTAVGLKYPGGCQASSGSVSESYCTLPMMTAPRLPSVAAERSVLCSRP